LKKAKKAEAEQKEKEDLEKISNFIEGKTAKL
jgi:hypothetical protein